MNLHFILIVLKSINAVVVGNNINDPNTELCVPNAVKNINVKVFNLIPRTNKTRHTE